MRRLILSAVLAFAPWAALAEASAPAPVSVPIGVFDQTMTGQPITVPAGPLEVRASRTTIPLGAQLPAHKHPYPRYAYILQGEILVTNLETGIVRRYKAGEFAIESRDQWHKGEAVGDGPAVLLVIDQAPPGAVNVVAKGP
ncbi:cupin domain-containing protein [Phenylobacterium aquaticum]|uniref:cupin domain-containing protein n=1 Tax=Phenylobacterium aquaticum TaxID=1763816 RepID=UPI0026EE25AD|nr:cupin domain-containing protein [Phenylobacterium aquaticum]